MGPRDGEPKLQNAIPPTNHTSPKYSQTSHEFMSPISSQSYFFRFLKFSDLEFDFFFLNMGPYGWQNYKTTFELFLSFCFQYPHKVTFFRFFKFYKTLKFNMGVNGKS